MFKRLFSTIFQIPGLIFGTLFVSIFLIVGISLALFGYTNLRNMEKFEKTPLSSAASIQPDAMVKIKFTPKNSNIIDSSISKTKCVFYKSDYYDYYRDDDGVYKSLVDSNHQPETITLTADGQNFVVSTTTPEPNFAFKHTNVFLKDRSSKNYLPTSKTSFTAGDKIIKEQLLLPDDEILLFGKVDSIEDLPQQNAKLLKFYKADIASPFEDPPKFFHSFVDVLLKNKLIYYVISSEDEKKTAEIVESGSTTALILFGLAFCIIPLIILISIWWSFISSFIGKR